MLAALATGGELKVDSVAGISVSTQSSSAIPNAVRIAPDDDRITWLGGRSERGRANKYVDAVLGQSTTLADETIISGTTGLPRWRIGLANGIRFTLPAGASEFEMMLGDGLAETNLALLIDGVATNSDGYDSKQSLDGSILYSHFKLPAAPHDRIITVNFGGRPFFGLNLTSASDIAEPVANEPLSVVFIGDSITAGSGSTMPDKSWPMQAAYRLGIGYPIVSGAGGSGYVARFPSDIGNTFEDRIDDVRLAVNGAAPDAVIVAGGINDCSVAPGSPYSMEEVGDAAFSYFEALRAIDPEMPIFVIGPFTNYSHPTYSQTSRECRDVIFRAARRVSGTFTIDVADWVTEANKDIVFDGKVNGPHPVDGGHAIYGRRAADSIAAILRQ